MTTRDVYVALLEKRAMEETSTPHVDSQDVAGEEHKKNMRDSNTYLNELFDNAKTVETNQSSELRKLLPGVEGTRETSNPLLKVAKANFLTAISGTEFFKTASPIHLELAFSSFCRELEKIAAFKPQTMADVARKNQVAMKMPQKTWNIAGPAGMGGSAIKPMGTGTTLNGQGMLARAGKALGFMK